MTRLLTLFIAFALVACESDFEKCMNTELPRAKQLLKVEDQARKITSLSAIAERLEIVVPIFQKAIDWEAINPPPIEAKKRDRFEFDERILSLSDLNDEQKFAEANRWSVETDELFEAETAEYQAALKLYETRIDEFYFQNGKEAGFSGDTWEEMYGIETGQYQDLYDEVSDLVRDRAVKLDCWGSTKCEDPLFLELQSQAPHAVLVTEDPLLGIAPAAVAESLSMAIEKLSEFEIQSNDLAIVRCNNNGLYE